MNKLALACCFAALSLPVGGAAEPARVDDFSLIDHQGRFHQLSRYAGREAVVIFSQANGDAVSRKGHAKLLAVQEEFAGHAVEILMLNAKHGDTREAIRAEAEANDFAFPILIDESQLVAESLGLRSTGEVLVIDPKGSDILYRGPISAEAGGELQNYLAESLAAVIEGRSIELDAPEAAGVALQFPHRERHQAQPPSYAEDVAPILQRRCVSCHQQGGLAPWAMNSHEMVQGFSLMMREVLMTKRMPPGQIDNFNLGNFYDVHHITPQEESLLVHWIEAGAPRGGADDPLAEHVSTASEWRLGPPDLVVDIPPQEVPAAGVVDYLYIPVELNLTEDKWLRAYEFKVGDKEVLHHIIAFSSDSEAPMSRQLLGGYGPGKAPRVLPDKTGVLLTPTTRFVMQIHYTPNGKATVDHTQMGLYFMDETPELKFRNDQAVNFGFTIPPETEDSPATAQLALKKDAYVYSFSPHMHFRGKRMDYSALYPDGTKELLINVPNYRFDWQMDYYLKEPKLLPAGTKIVVDGGFDNSSTNPFNPDASKEVKWGDQSWEEMFIGFVGLANADGS